MPPVSQAQRAAMHAAAEGKSTIGIPASVAAEFVQADPGGPLPKRKKHRRGRRAGKRHPHPMKVAAMKQERGKARLAGLRQRLAAMRNGR